MEDLKITITANVKKKVSLQRQRLSDQIVKGIKKTMNVQLSFSSQRYIHEQLGKLEGQKQKKKKKNKKQQPKETVVATYHSQTKDFRFQDTQSALLEITLYNNFLMLNSPEIYDSS